MHDAAILTERFDRALHYATHGHGGQVRKGTSTPYIAHLLAVSATVMEYGGNEDLAIAALLHDSVEDQGGKARLEDVRNRFGERVARVVEACSPALWSRSFANEGRTGDQHDAFSIADWLSRTDRDGSLAAFLNPDLSPPGRTPAQVEGWTLGVPGLIRSGKGRDDSATPNACDPRLFRLH